MERKTIKQKATTPAFREGWDRVFGNIRLINLLNRMDIAFKQFDPSKVKRVLNLDRLE